VNYYRRQAPIPFLRLKFVASIASTAILATSSAFAYSENAQSFTYQGQLLSSAGSPLSDSSVVLVLSLYNPAKNCLLYEETQIVDTSGTDGMFSIQMGQSALTGGKRTSNDPGLGMATIFRNDGSQIRASGPNCVSGYTASAGDARVMQVKVTPSSTGTQVTLSPDETIDSVPQAWSAETFQGIPLGNFIQLSGSDAVIPTGNGLKVNGAEVIDANGNWVGSSTGLVGATGPAGAAGATGATGATGTAGATGVTGATGAAGSTGATGATGATGPTGTAGSNGATGATGATGVAGVSSQLKVAFLTSGTSWTTSANINSSTGFKITLIGGGGGGGGVKYGSSFTTSGGGGAGAVAIWYVSGLSANTSYSFSIGAAGAAGASTPANGSTGGNTSITIGSTTIIAGGGSGGTSNTSGSQSVAGGAGGTVTGTATIAIAGQAGGSAYNIPGAGASTPYGTGGPSPASGGSQNFAGNNATGYGAGGSGAIAGANNNSYAGGAGAPGAILIEWNE
jgi:hypothetical protein